MSRAVKNCLPPSSQLPPTADCLSPLSALLLSPWCLQAVPSALLCFAEELLTGRVVSLQRCPVVMSSLCPRRPAQLSSRGPAQGITFLAASGLAPGLPGAPEEPAVKQAEGITQLGSEPSFQHYRFIYQKSSEA